MKWFSLSIWSIWKISSIKYINWFVYSYRFENTINVYVCETCDFKIWTKQVKGYSVSIFFSLFHSNVLLSHVLHSKYETYVSICKNSITLVQLVQRKSLEITATRVKILILHEVNTLRAYLCAFVVFPHDVAMSLLSFISVLAHITYSVHVGASARLCIS